MIVQYNIPMSIYRCFVFNFHLETARFLCVKNKALSKRFSIMSVPTQPPSIIQTTKGIGREQCKITT